MTQITPEQALEALDRAEKNGDLTTWLRCHLPTIKAALSQRVGVTELTIEEAMLLVDYDFNGKTNTERGAQYLLRNLSERFPDGIIIKGA